MPLAIYGRIMCLFPFPDTIPKQKRTCKRRKEERATIAVSPPGRPAYSGGGCALGSANSMNEAEKEGFGKSGSVSRLTDTYQG